MADTVPAPSSRQALLVHRDHRRTFEDNLYVYAVVSRRSKGVSIGLNLNPDKVCNFDCVYCLVDRKTPPLVRTPAAAEVVDGVGEMLLMVETGQLFGMVCFRNPPTAELRLNDIAFSRYGEPTTCPEFL